MNDSNSTARFCPKCQCETERHNDGRCKPCKIKYRNENKEKKKLIDAKWYAKNKAKVNARWLNWASENKEHRKEYNANWKKDNSNGDKSKYAIWREKHKDALNEKNRAYKKANPEREKARYAAWKAKHPDAGKARSAAWRLANPERERNSHIAWRAANPEAYKIHNQNRRALKIGNGGTLSKGLSEKLFKLQKGKCACCKQPLGDKYHLDHIVPLALGGTNTDDNIQLLRPRCNSQKHAKHPIDFMQERGFLL